MTLARVRVLSPAKINLHLRVGPARADGFHPLSTWMVTVGLFDKLDFSVSPGAGVALTCDAPGLACDESNLVVKAARLLAGRAKSQGIRVHLAKRIPTGAGLGGGSGNAATTLSTLARLWHLDLSTSELSRLGASLGSDVPFFFGAPSAVCRGRGELVTPVGAPRAAWAVLVLPGVHVSTPAVYRRYDGRARVDGWDTTVDYAAWSALPTVELLSKLVNDLEAPAFDLVPELAGLRAATERVVGRPVRMSGSGSTLFTLFDAHADAVDAARRVHGDTRVGNGPVKTAVVRIGACDDASPATFFDPSPS